MKSLIKIITGLIVTAVVLIGGALLAVLFLFDPNDYRDDIETLIEKQTGREVTIEGELGLSVLPCCAVEAGRTTLSNPAGFSDTDFLSFDKAAVSVQVLPLLLEQRVEIGLVTLDGLNVTLETRADGSVNWEFAESAAETKPQEKTPSGEAGIAINDLSAAGFELRNATLRWLDDTSGDDIVLSDLQVLSGPVEMQQPFDLEASFNIDGLADGVSAGFDLQARPIIDPGLATATLNGAKIVLKLRSDELPRGAAEVNLNVGALLVGGEQAVVIADNVALNITSGPLQIDVTASGRVSDRGPDFSGTLATNEFSPRDLLESLNTVFETPDADVLTRAKVDANWLYRSDRFALTELVSVLDDTRMNGWLRLDSIANEQIRTELQIDDINVDRYLSTGDESGDSSTGAVSSGGTDELPVESLRTLDAQARLGIGRLVFSDAQLTDVSMTMVAKDGRLRINPLVAKLYGGAYNGDIQLDVRGKQPVLQLAQVVKGVQVGELLNDTSELENIAGLFETELNASSRGQTVDELIAGLNGDLRFDLQDAVYAGRDFWYELRFQKAKLKGDTLPLAPENPKTDISKMLGTGVIENGVVTNKDFAMQIPFLRISGAGQADLNASSVDYQLNAKVVGRPQFDDGSNLDELQGLTLPVTITGQMDDPKIRFDLTSVIAGLATQKLQERLLKKYGGVSEKPAAEEPVSEDATEAGSPTEQAVPEGEAQLAPKSEPEPESEMSERDQRKELIRDSLRDLF